ncbi:unnamed protein product [marine sediment metagenome]|uniref:Uncharacterized protein n=1 Tax=marine sediment metagenome TaxID=412755 RepID=X0TGV9_9ZZZZ
MTKLDYDRVDQLPALRELRSLEAKLIIRDIQKWLDFHGMMLNIDDRRAIARLTGILALYVRM